MKILITGGTGFIGSHLTEELVKKGHSILLITRDAKRAAEHLTEFGLKNTEIAELDLTEDRLTWKTDPIFRFAPDTAIHTAWEGIPDFSFAQSYKNVNASLNLYAVLSEANCKKVITTGTCAEYGAVTGKISESTPIIMPAQNGGSYQGLATGKIATLNIGAQMAKERGMQFIWARLFFVYGPRMRKAALIPYIIGQKKLGLIPELKSPKSGNDYIFITDAVRALATLAERDQGNNFRAYNIGSGKLTPNTQIVRYFFPDTADTDYKNEETEGFYADISSMQEEYSWLPLTALDEGLQKTAGYFGI